MSNALVYLCPTTLRLNRKKNKFDRILPFISIAFFITFLLYNHLNSGYPISNASFEALKKLIVLYITYLIMLELSPDTSNIYMLSYIIIGICLIPFSNLYMSTTLFFLFNIRILTKSSGYRSSVFELGVMLIFTIMEYFFSPFLYPMLFAIILILDYKFKHTNAQNIPFIVVSVLMSLLWINSGFSLMESNLSIFPSLLVIFVGIAYILRLSLLKTILSYNDIESSSISPKRVKAASLILLLALIIMAIAHAMVLEFINLWIMIACISFPFIKDLKYVFK